MKRAQYSQRGPVPQEFIDAVDFELPPLTSGQVLIQVLAAPINPSDVLTLTGGYGILPPLPAVGGNEGVGKVIQLGPDVSTIVVGQTVMLPVGGGTWATHMIGEAKKLMPLPNDADPLQLAMMTVNPPTASLLLSEFVDLNAGDWVIQNAANSGVGEYLIQLAKVRGFKTVNIVRRESAIAEVKIAGGDVVLVDGEGLAKRVADATGGAAIRLGIDAVGGPPGNRPARGLSCAGRNACQLRHDEWRTLRGFHRIIRVSRYYVARILAGALVPQSDAGTSKRRIWRNCPNDRHRKIDNTHPRDLRHRKHQRCRRRCRGWRTERKNSGGTETLIAMFLHAANNFSKPWRLPMKTVILFVALAFATLPAFAKKSCEELKAELEAKIQAKGVKTFTLNIVPKDEKTDLRVIGTCDGGAKKIVYKRG